MLMLDRRGLSKSKSGRNKESNIVFGIDDSRELFARKNSYDGLGSGQGIAGNGNSGQGGF